MPEYASIIVNAVVSIVSIFGGILTASKLTNYRIAQLEKRLINIIISPKESPLCRNRLKLLIIESTTWNTGKGENKK